MVLPLNTQITTWIDQQNAFERQENIRQVAYKQNLWPELENGHLTTRPQHYYPHILPEGNERKAFYEPLYDQIKEYIESERIAMHSEALNLKS